MADAQTAEEQFDQVGIGADPAGLCQPRLRTPCGIAEAHIRQHKRRPRQELEPGIANAEFASGVSLDGCRQRRGECAWIEKMNGNGNRGEYGREQHACRQ